MKRRHAASRKTDSRRSGMKRNWPKLAALAVAACLMAGALVGLGDGLSNSLSNGLVARLQAYFAVVDGRWLDMRLPITRIEVKGDLRHVDRLRLAARLRAQLDGGYFTVDLPRLRALALANPWVREARIRKRWPDRLIVAIEEKRAVARWNGKALISAQGDVFAATLDDDATLPEMFGPAGQHKTVWRFMNTIYPPLAAMGLQVSRLQLDQRRAWRIRLQATGQENATAIGQTQNATVLLKLGREHTMQRFRRFVEIFSAAGAPPLARLQAIDMRYPNGFAVLPRAVETAAAQAVTRPSERFATASGEMAGKQKKTSPRSIAMNRSIIKNSGAKPAAKKAARAASGA